MAGLNPPAPPPILYHLNASLQLQGDGTFAYWQQDTEDDVGQCVQMICGTIIGQRTVVPLFGLPDQTFTNPNKQTILAAINTWEPRAKATINISFTSDNNAQIVVQVAPGGLTTTQ